MTLCTFRVCLEGQAAGTWFFVRKYFVEDWTEAQADAAFEEISRRVLALAEVEDDAARVAEGKKIVKMIYETEARCQWSGLDNRQ
ncbi:hypothetical protein BJF89_13665 [Corynebacterium sp. CNJ-954]|uniref:hypothetical protein n=1 Tax=Corynebacterium sp. CNJ-954 TaxID=1904962 RepID=UPI000966A740|nr:hypothetical protein [Corynebacterium sp. CNJ-954]OLT55829.1 hypothetical protein BJF89_13665 [Corynebacterium sp. CNJ-954]